DSAEAERLIADMPLIYTFYGGLHSPETGSPEMVMEMAYRLAASDHPTIRQIRDQLVVFIVPVAEPDGRDRVVEWHARYNADTYFMDDSKGGPPYWGKYIFHDNNRDGLQLTARLTQELVSLFLEWKFPVGHDLHESVPYLYVSTGTGPYNPTVDPITISEWQWMSNFEVTSLTAKGMPGVWTHGFYTGWYPGYLLWVTNTRNAVGRFYETFGNSFPNTVERELGEGSTRVEWYRPNPPRDTTLWSLRNNTNYMQTGALAALQLVAQNRAMFLENFWKKSNNSLNKGRTQAPYAYLIPAVQERRADVGYMVNLLQRQGLEIHRAKEDGTFGEVEVLEGDFVLRMDQPYRNYAYTLMERQDFPEDAPAPYDDVAWTYPHMFNVEAHPVDDAAVQSELEMETLAGPVTLEGRVHGRRGDSYLVRPSSSAHLMRARLALGAIPVRVANGEVAVNDEITLAPGAWILEADAAGVDVASWVREHGFDAFRVSEDLLDGVPTHEMDLPRIALLHTWTRTQDEGWARFTLDQQGVAYDYVGEDKIGSMGDLRSRYDVILFPHQGARNTAKRIFQGRDPEDGPMPYTRTPEYPTHGFPDATEDMTGGMGFEGLMALRDFVEAGGTLLAVGSAATVPVDFGFSRDVNLRDPGSIFIPGSLLKGEVADATDPLTYGYGETLPLYHQYGPYFSVSDDAEDRIAVTYASGEGMLLSGIARGAGDLGGQPALFSEQIGEGFLVLYGFDALHRHQNHGNHALVWNAILNWNDLGRE
ncbi:MAG: M14 family zinc carboxypeptidase, partial [Longimicrobiales bacterium]